MPSVMKLHGVQYFLKKMEQFYFCPPSDNLWTIRIQEHTYGDNDREKSLATLYSNIISVNRSWNTAYMTNWQVLMDDEMRKDFQKLYINELGGKGEKGDYFFLANNVTINPFQAAIDPNQTRAAYTHGGFLNQGFVTTGMTGGRECNISFFETNWSIADLLFDPWIAAILQRGLIEHADECLKEGQSIKADIFINNYSVDAPFNKETNDLGMVLRKEIKLFNAFPTERGQIELKYDQGTAGTFKNRIVKFYCDEYQITYHNKV